MKNFFGPATRKKNYQELSECDENGKIPKCLISAMYVITSNLSLFILNNKNKQFKAKFRLAIGYQIVKLV